MSNQDDWLNLQVGEKKPLHAEGFFDFFRNAIYALKSIDKTLSAFGTESIEWEIVDAKSNSPIVATISSGSPSSQNTEHGRKIISTLLSGLESLNSRKAPPNQFSTRTLRYVRQMASIANRYGLVPVLFVADTRVYMQPSVASNADWAMKEMIQKKQNYIEYGSIIGRLKELASVSQKRDRLLVVDDLTGEETKCILRGSGLDLKAATGWKHRVMVCGEIVIEKTTHRRTKILADDIRLLRSRSELPQIEALYGIDITGGVESSAYIRSLRDVE